MFPVSLASNEVSASIPRFSLPNRGCDFGDAPAFEGLQVATKQASQITVVAELPFTSFDLSAWHCRQNCDVELALGLVLLGL